AVEVRADGDRAGCDGGRGEGEDGGGVCGGIGCQARVRLDFSMETVVFDRIVSDPAILGGKPCIKGTRISVEFILELIASRSTVAEIVRKYPQLTPDDVE